MNKCKILDAAIEYCGILGHSESFNYDVTKLYNKKVVSLVDRLIEAYEYKDFEYFQDIAYDNDLRATNLVYLDIQSTLIVLRRNI